MEKEQKRMVRVTLPDGEVIYMTPEQLEDEEMLATGSNFGIRMDSPPLVIHTSRTTEQQTGNTSNSPKTR